MKNLIKCCLALLLLAPMASYALSGRGLYEMCHGSPSETAACTQYVQGVNDTLVSIAGVNNTKVQICPPKGTNMGQLIDTGLRGIDSSPDAHLPAALLLIKYWVDAYPCGKK
jgi:hypothetical protein